jgi:hypothetical protein
MLLGSFFSFCTSTWERTSMVFCAGNISAHLYNGYKVDTTVDTIDMHMGWASTCAGRRSVISATTSEWEKRRRFHMFRIRPWRLMIMPFLISTSRRRSWPVATVDKSSKVWNGRYCRFSAVVRSYDAQIAVFRALGISGMYCSASLKIYLYRM